MKIKIDFNCDNAAFDFPETEIESVLEQAKNKILSSIDDDGLNICEFRLKDTNGNTIGNVRVEA